MAKWFTLNWCPWIPHRVYVCISCFLGVTISYTMRFSLSLAMTEMVQAEGIKEDPYACPYPEGGSRNKTFKELEFDWTEEQQGFVHSAFFWGYLVTHVPGGLAAERFGAKIVLVVFVTLTSFCCSLTPLVTRVGGYIALVCLRICLGLSQGMVYTSLNVVVTYWVPTQERGFLSTLIFSGAYAGNVLNNLFTGLMLHWFPGEWPLVFYVWGTLGVLWTIIFALTTYSYPSTHDKMKQKERDILDAYAIEVDKSDKALSTPWKEIFKSMPVYAIAVGMMGHDWGFFALVTQIPKFIKSVLHFDVKENGFINAGMFSIMWAIGISSGVLVDYLQRKNYLKKIHSRKIGTTIASVGPSLGLIGAVYSGCSLFWSTFFLIMGMSVMGTFYPSLKVNPIDLTSNFAGTIGAIGHVSGSAAGIVVPYLVGYLTPQGYLSEWRIVFWITFGVMSVTNIFYVIFASASIQPWNTPKAKDET